MDKLEFEYPDDFQDEVVDTKIHLVPPPPFKASSILYGASGSFFLGAVLLVMFEVLTRPREGQPDTFIELLEWNPYSQMGAIGVVLGVFMFLLGVMVDRRGA